MALFRKLFYRKPPDGLLEICERVYVFDRCFTTDALEDQDYRGYVGGIVTQLREIYPDASILAFNFREGDTQSEIGNALSEYDMTIMEYPKHYEGCPLLPMEVIHHFLRSSESWLSLGLQNVLLMHCERGGWPVLAFMLAALLIYRKHYSGEQKTLDMVYKQAPRELLHLLSPLNPIPSQLRYLQYVSRRNVATQWPPLDRALTLDCIMIRMIPNFDGEGGCRPIFRIYGQDPCLVSDRTPKVLFSTPKKSRVVRHYKQAECEIVKVDINCHIQGDVVLECISLHDDMKREVMMFRVMFNTAFIRSNILMLNRDEIDVLWDAKDLFPRDFRAEVLFSEMDTVASVIPVDSSCFEEKEGLPVEAFAKVQEIFSSVDWLSPKGEAAAEVLQQLAVSNTAIEAFSHAALGIKSITKSPSNLSLECQSNLSPQSSPNADVSRNQAEPQSSPTKIGPIIFPRQTLMPSGDHSPPSSTSPHQLSVAKTLHLSPNQRSDSNENGMVKRVSPVSEAKIAYPNNLPPGPPAQPTKDVNLVPGRSPLSPEPFPITPSLEEKIGLQNSSSSLPLLTPEIPSTLSPPLKDDTTIKPAISCPPAESRRNHDKVIEYEPPKVKPPFSTTSSAEDFVGGPIVANPPPRASSPPQIHPSSIVNVEKSTGAGSASPWTTLCSNIGVIQVTECGSPAPHLSFPKTDTILKTALRTPPPTDLDATFTKESSTSICPTPPAPLPPTSHFTEKSECVVGPSSPPAAPYITDSSKADRPASCLHPLPPPLPPLLGPPLSAAATPPPAPLLQEHYVPEAVPPPPLTPPLRDISVARPVPHLPPPPPKFPKAISSGGESTSPDSGNDASSSAPPLGDSLVTETVPCPPPPPPLPPKEISVGGEPPFHPPPLYYGQGTTSLPTLSPRPSPPSPATPTTRSSPIPSAPPPPLASPSTRSSPCVPLAPPPPPASPSTRSSHSVPLAPPPPPVSPATKSSIPLAPPPPPGSPNIRSSPSIPSAPPPPPASPNIRSSSIPSAPPPPPASPSTKSSIPSAPPPPPGSPNLRSSPSIPSAAPPPPASPNTRSSPSVPSAPPPPPASPTTRSSPSVPSAPPPPFPSTNDPASLSTIGSKGSSLPGSPSPPGPPPPGTKGKSLLSRTIRNNVTKKLKPLHWLKISRAVSGSLWAEAQKSGEASRAPEIDISELESLFSAAVSTADQDGSGRKTGSRGMGSKPEKVQLIEHRRAYNCEIMLSKVKIPLHEMLSSVLALEDSALDVDQVDNLIKFCPTKEEMEVLKGYKGERDRLGKCEQFFLELMQVPRIEFKLRVYSFKIQFHSQASDLRNNLNIVNSAADQIRVSGKLRRIMQTILNLGNALNQGTARGSAVGFRLDSLLKLTDTRARNNKMTLMHYLCKVLSDQLPELLDFWKDLSSLELASRIQLKYLAEEMQAINKGLEKVMQELSMAENDGPVCDQFCKALKEFLCFSEGEVRSLASLYAGVGRNVDSLILYFGEDPARCQFEQVISTLMNFVRMFKQAHEENCKQIELEKKKAEKEAMEKMKMNAPDTGHLLQSQVKSVK